MRIGQRRHRVELQQPTRTRDSMGGFTDSYSMYTTVWADILGYGKAGEETESSAQTGKQRVRINIRYNSDIELTHQVVFDSRVFEINAIDNIRQLNKELLLSCTEIL